MNIEVTTLTVTQNLYYTYGQDDGTVRKRDFVEVLSACTISILSENMLHNSSVFSMELIYKIVILCNITKFFTVPSHLVI